MKKSRTITIRGALQGLWAPSPAWPCWHSVQFVDGARVLCVSERVFGPVVRWPIVHSDLSVVDLVLGNFLDNLWQFTYAALLRHAATLL